MFRDLVVQAFNDMFDHLGDECVYQSRNGTETKLIVVVKQPENPYEIGDSQIIERVAEVTVKSADVTPRIGDYIIANSKTYKIYEEPLLDASNLIWKFHAVLVEN